MNDFLKRMKAQSKKIAYARKQAEELPEWEAAKICVDEGHVFDIDVHGPGGTVFSCVRCSDVLTSESRAK